MNSATSLLRVGLDGRAFNSPAGGVRRYVHDLVPALLALGEPLEIIALGGERGSLPPGVGHVAEPLHPPTNLGWMAVGMPIAAARARVDLIHAPAYTAPFLTRRPLVVTIHDVSYARHPEWNPYKRDFIRSAFYRRCARAASSVLTDSAFSAAEIVAAYGIPPARIAVVPLGVSPSFAPGAPNATPALPRGVTAPFLLHVGDLHERRNLPVLLEALFEARRAGSGSALSLVLAGIDRGVGDRLSALAAEAGTADAVVRLGMVEEEGLHRLYQSATALVYPSRYEGFGLPVLEAMASGTPVIASRAASIPEVLGDAGMLLDPDQPAEWTDAILRVAGDASLRADMRTRGLARAATFTWAHTARLTYDVYRRTVARVRGAA